MEMLKVNQQFFLGEEMMWKKEKQGGADEEVREAVGVAGKKCVMRGRVMEK